MMSYRGEDMIGMSKEEQWKQDNEMMREAMRRAEKAEAEVERLSLWKWSENSNDGSNYNPLLSEICKRAAMALGYDSLRLRQAMATAMYNVLSEGEEVEL